MFSILVDPIHHKVPVSPSVWLHRPRHGEVHYGRGEYCENLERPWLSFTFQDDMEGVNIKETDAEEYDNKEVYRNN